MKFSHSHNSIFDSLECLKHDPNGLSLAESAQQSIVLKDLLSSWPALDGVVFEVGQIKNSQITGKGTGINIGG